MKKKVLLISSGTPNYGGAATTMFNLEKLLKNDFETKLVYFKNDDFLSSNPNTSDDIIEIDRSKNILWKLYKLIKELYLKFCKLFSLKVVKPKLWNNYIQISSMFLLVNRLDLKKFLAEKKFSPDIIISNLPTYFKLVNSFETKYKIIIVNGCTEMSYLAHRGIDASSFLRNPSLLNGVKKNAYDFEKLQIIFNSMLTKKVYESLNVKLPNATVQHFNLTPVSKIKNKAFHERKIHLAYFVSNTSRVVKNPELAMCLFNDFPEVNKVCVGKGSLIFKNIKNTSVNDLITQQDLYELMNDIRLVIIPSFYDSSPGIMTEALLRGCNVLVSKNIGWNEYLNEECVVDSFDDLNEWKDKAFHLMEQYNNNDKIIQLFSQSPLENLSFFNNLISSKN